MNYINIKQPTVCLICKAYNLLQKTLFPKDTMTLKLKFTETILKRN